MRMSRLYMPTLREVPADAEIPSHQLLLRAGMMRRISTGIYSYLPLGYKALREIENVIREEMDKLGAQEVLTSSMQPKELWESDESCSVVQPEMFKFMDKSGKEFCLGHSHGEYLINLIKNEVRSYKQLPLTLYQIQNKYKDEIKPRYGIIKAKEFVLKEAYSFDKDVDSMDKSYMNMWKTYENVFAKLKLKYKIVEASSNVHQFIATTKTGDESFAYCDGCDYAANMQSAKVVYEPYQKDDVERSMERVHTPNVTTIEDLEKFFNIEKSNFGKSLIYVADGKTILVVIPGDRELNEIKANYEDEEVKYPGKRVIEEGIKLINQTRGMSKPIDVFKYLYKNEDAYLDFIEKYSPIKSFFKGSQKEIWKKTQHYVSVYEESKSYILNEEIEKIVDEMRYILSMASPYNRIKDLPQLNNKFHDLYNEILDKELEPVIKEIEQAKERVMEELEKTGLMDKFGGRYSNSFDDLIVRAEACNNVARVNGFKIEAETLKKRYLKEISKEISKVISKVINTPPQPDVVSDGGEVKTQPEVKPVIRRKYISIREINPYSSWRIESKEDIDRYLQDLKERLEKEMEENTILNIEF